MNNGTDPFADIVDYTGSYVEGGFSKSPWPVLSVDDFSRSQFDYEDKRSTWKDMAKKGELRGNYVHKTEGGKPMYHQGKKVYQMQGHTQVSKDLVKLRNLGVK